MPISTAMIPRSPALADMEPLCYVGMRSLLGGAMSRRRLRACAARCASEIARFSVEWTADTPLPPVRMVGWDHLADVLEGGHGAIVATPHVGPFKRLPIYLWHRGLAVTMLLDTPNYESEVSRCDEWMRAGHRPGRIPMEYINADLPTSAWEMSRHLQAGRVIVGWLDGDSGVETHENAQSTVTVDFCRSRIRVRKGLAALSAFAGAPIVPAVTTCAESGRHHVRFLEPVAKAADETGDAFHARAMQFLYRELEVLVMRDPACWQLWYRVPRWIERPAAPSTAVLPTPTPDEVLLMVPYADPDRVEIVEFDAAHSLVRIDNGEAIVMTPGIVDLLGAMNGRRTIAQVIRRLARVYSEDEVLSLILPLAEQGFVSVAQRSDAPSGQDSRP